jgi:biopolymer transport protein ExbD
MQLSLTVPERPGLIYFMPFFDFIVLIFALVLLSGVSDRESYVDISPPVSEFRGQGLGDEKPVVVVVRHGGKGTRYYVSKQPVEEGNLEEAIIESAEARATRLVVLRIDETAPLSVEQQLVDLCRHLDFTCKRAVRMEDQRRQR